MLDLQLESSRQLMQRRLNWLVAPLVLIFVLLGMRLWWLQILQGPEYTRLAEKNRIRSIQVVAPRGPILDRNRLPLAENRPSINIVLDREVMKNPDATAAFVTGMLGIPPEEFADKLRRSRRTGAYQPIVIREDADIRDVSIVEAHKREYPEILLTRVPRRLYHYGNLASHVLGYVREVSEGDLESNTFPGAKRGDLVGKFGVERAYNQCLTGLDGAREVLVDSLGRELGTVAEKEAVIGGDLQLTLDYDLQVTAETLLAGKVGAIVAMDPRNGEILAMAGAPSFNPNSLSTRITAEEWNAILNDPDHPLQNRAIQNSYPPGSIFKLVIAEAGLGEDLVDENTSVVCRGSAVFYNNLFHCWKPSGHGYVNLENAIAQSCNVFFYTLGQRLGIEKIVQHAKALGFGERTGVDLPGETAGVLPGGAPWYPGETISVSIGQGQISATPLQVLRAVSALATGGTVVTPHLLLRAERGSDGAGSWPVQQIPIQPESLQRIRAGMWASVNSSGTSHGTAIPGFDICGKTGTVQIIGAERKRTLKSDLSAFENHAWFAGFASRDDPEIAMVVFIEHGGGGGAAAAPLAKEMFQTYFDKKYSEELLTRVSGTAGGREVR